MRNLVVPLLFGALLALLAPLAEADVEISKVGPVSVETGSWSAHLMRRDAPMQCPIGTTRDCYFVYLDIRNASDRILDCTAQIRWENGSVGVNSTSVSATVSRRSAQPVVTLNAGAKVNGNLQYSVSCSARAGSTNPTPPPTTPSGTLGFEGSPGFELAADRTQFTVRNTIVANRRASGVSGSLTLEVVLTAQKGATSGTRIATISLGTLSAQTGVTVNRTVPISPPSGTYYVVYALFENGTRVDRVDFDGTVTIGGTSPPAPPPPAAGYLRIEPGNVTINSSRTVVTLWSLRVVNTRASGTSGSLTMEVWFTSQPTGSSGIRGGQFSVGVVAAGNSTSTSRDVAVSPPPPGSYYIALVLREGGTEVDRVTLDGKFTVSSSAAPAPSTGGGGTSGGGGGSGSMGAAGAGLLFLLMLGRTLNLRSRAGASLIRLRSKRQAAKNGSNVETQGHASLSGPTITAECAHHGAAGTIGILGLALSLSGCAVLETTGEVVGGIAQAVGETTLFVADVATFGAVSSLTGLKDSSWAASPETSASMYSAAGSGYVEAKSSTPGNRSAAGGGSASHAGTSTYGGNAGSATKTTANTSNDKQYSGSDLRQCVSLVNDSNTLASYIQNSCSEKLTVSYVPSNGMGAGSRGTQFVAGGSRQSINKTSGISGVIVCRYGDLMDQKSGACRSY